jgi:hypothetical protein
VLVARTFASPPLPGFHPAATATHISLRQRCTTFGVALPARVNMLITGAALAFTGCLTDAAETCADTDLSCGQKSVKRLYREVYLEVQR